MEIASTDRKAAEAVVDAAIIAHWVNDGIEISSRTRLEWIEAVMLNPEVVSELFAVASVNKNIR
jgi:hypothetical protein